jgi:hypothetical protein
MVVKKFGDCRKPMCDLGIARKVTLRCHKATVPLQTQSNQSFRKSGIQLKVMNQPTELSHWLEFVE